MDAQQTETLASDGTQSQIPPDQVRSILSNLSQEFSRPLVTLRMGFDLLLADETRRPITNDQRGHVQTMVSLCDDLLRLTHTYLDYAGLVHGARPLSLADYTVSALIREIDRQFNTEAVERKISWDCQFDGPDANVKTDASLCQQIFGKIVSNALKYTGEGGEVRVSGRVVDTSWVVTVVDNGSGIRAEHLNRVFEPFYRLNCDERRQADGNGLGLAICREMVNQLAGEVTLTSNPGQGTCVTVQFPLDSSTRQLVAKGGR